MTQAEGAATQLYVKEMSKKKYRKKKAQQQV